MNKKDLHNLSSKFKDFEFQMVTDFFKNFSRLSKEFKKPLSYKEFSSCLNSIRALGICYFENEKGTPSELSLKEALLIHIKTPFKEEDFKMLEIEISTYLPKLFKDYYDKNIRKEDYLTDGFYSKLNEDQENKNFQKTKDKLEKTIASYTRKKMNQKTPDKLFRINTEGKTHSEIEVIKREKKIELGYFAEGRNDQIYEPLDQVLYLFLTKASYLSDKISEKRIVKIADQFRKEYYDTFNQLKFEDRKLCFSFPSVSYENGWEDWARKFRTSFRKKYKKPVNQVSNDYKNVSYTCELRNLTDDYLKESIAFEILK